METATMVSDAPKKIDGIDEWEVRDAASTLRRAFEIKENSKLFKAAVKELKKEEKAAKQALGWSSDLT